MHDDSAPKNAIEFDEATLRIGDRAILSDVSFAVRQGEFVGLLGPNGAGKTTLLRAILGLLQPARGAVRVLGGAPRLGARTIGYMPQVRGAIDMRWSGRDFVASGVGGHRWGLPHLSAGERADIDAALETVGAADIARRPLGELSGGERQRLLLSQALIGRPKILLLDEPLISLDPAHQHTVVAIAKKLRDELNVTVVFSAHELNPLLGAVDRVLYVGNGAAVLGSVDEVITSKVLSRLYGADIEVLRVGSRIFVVAGDVEIESEAHRHDHHGHHAHSH